MLDTVGSLDGFRYEKSWEELVQNGATFKTKFTVCHCQLDASETESVLSLDRGSQAMRWPGGRIQRENDGRSV